MPPTFTSRINFNFEKAQAIEQTAAQLSKGPETAKITRAVTGADQRYLGSVDSGPDPFFSSFECTQPFWALMMFLI